MFWLFIIMLGVLLWTLVSKSGQSTREKEPSYSEFMAEVDRGNVKEVELFLSPTSYEVEGEKREPAEKFRVTIFKESAPDLVKTLRDKQVLINVKEVNRADWVSVLFSAAPVLLLVAFWIFMMRQMQAGGNKALSFGKSRARLLTAQQKKATFKDVAGTDEAKEELQEIIEFFKEPQKLRARRTFHSFRFPVPTSSRCLSASAQAACAICSNRARRTRPASSSSMKLTRWGAIAAPASAVATTNA